MRIRSIDARCRQAHGYEAGECAGDRCRHPPPCGPWVRILFLAKLHTEGEARLSMQSGKQRITRRAAVARAVGVALVPGAAWLAACGAASDKGASTAPGGQQAPATLRYAGPFTPSPSNTFAVGVTKVIDA